MTDRNDAPVDGLDDYLERFMSYPRTVRTDLGAVIRRRRPLRSRIAAPAGVALLTGALVAVLALALAHHQGAGGASGAGYKGKQLDIVLRTVNGKGNATTPLAPFPHARYTFFTEQDPPDCLRGVQVQNADGQYVSGDRADLIPDPNVRGQDGVPLVQDNLSEGDYKVRVDTDTARCTWRVYEILNSMSSPAAPPYAEPASPAPSATFVSSANPGQPLIVSATGIYRIGWTVTPQSPGTTCTNVQFSLRNSAGDLEYQGVASGNPTSPSAQGTELSPFFLASGEHPVTVQANCAWRMSLSPMLGPLGGGVQGFAAPPLPAPYTAVQVATMQLEGGGPGAWLDETLLRLAPT